MESLILCEECGQRNVDRKFTERCLAELEKQQLKSTMRVLCKKCLTWYVIGGEPSGTAGGGTHVIRDGRTH